MTRLNKILVDLQSPVTTIALTVMNTGIPRSLGPLPKSCRCAHRFGWRACGHTACWLQRQDEKPKVLAQKIKRWFIPTSFKIVVLGCASRVCPVFKLRFDVEASSVINVGTERRTRHSTRLLSLVPICYSRPWRIEAIILLPCFNPPAGCSRLQKDVHGHLWEDLHMLTPASLPTRSYSKHSSVCTTLAPPSPALLSSCSDVTSSRKPS